MTTDHTNTDAPAVAPAPARAPDRRWMIVTMNVLLALAIIALLIATWMPAIYDRLSTTKPLP